MIFAIILNNQLTDKRNYFGNEKKASRQFFETVC